MANSIKVLSAVATTTGRALQILLQVEREGLPMAGVDHQRLHHPHPAASIRMLMAILQLEHKEGHMAEVTAEVVAALLLHVVLAMGNGVTGNTSLDLRI